MMMAKRLLLVAVLVAPCCSLIQHKMVVNVVSSDSVDSGAFAKTDLLLIDRSTWGSVTKRDILPLWLLGVCICIAGTLFTSLGLVLQKYSHTKNAKLTDAVVYYSQPWWVVGFSVFLAGQIVGVVAMPMAPQAMLSCLGALSLVFNAIFAWAMLEENLHRLELVGMTGIIIGAYAVVHSTPVESGLELDTAGLGEIVGPLYRPAFLLLGAALMFLLGAFRIATLYSNPLLTSIFWALVSGVCSGYTVTLFKCISYLVVAWERTQPHIHWQCYLVLAVAVSLCIAQLHTVNTALHSGRAMSVVPTIFAFNLLAQIGIGEAAYMEMNGMTSHQAVGFIGGIAVILVCVVAIVRMSGMKAGAVDVESKLEESSDVAIDSEKGSRPSSPIGGWSGSPGGSKTMPPTVFRRLSLDSFEDLEQVFQRTESETWLESDNVNVSASFEGRSRSYTVSMTGPMGLA